MVSGLVAGMLLDDTLEDKHKTAALGAAAFVAVAQQQQQHDDEWLTAEPWRVLALAWRERPGGVDRCASVTTETAACPGVHRTAHVNQSK